MSTRMVNVWKLVVTLAVAAVLRCTYVHGQVSTLNYTNFFEFGVDAGDAELNKLAHSPTFTLSTPIQLFGRTGQTLFVWKYGDMDFVVGPLLLRVAPFSDVVDYRRFGNTFYRQTNDTTLLQKARDQLQELFLSSGNFTPTTLFIATWDRVAEFEGESQANTFQAVIAADQQKTFVFFIYGDIQWSFFPFIGFLTGDGPAYHVLHSQTNQALNIDEGSNVNVTGVYIYQVDCSVLGPNNDAVGCCSLRDPVNGRVESSNTTVGSTANYTCNQGYILSNGNSTHTCEANGQWSGSPPTCELNHPNFFDFGVNVGDAQLYGFYDASSPPINLSTPIQFYGTAQHTLFINTNGFISFNSPTWYFSHRTLLLSDVPVIVPFWARYATFGNIFYRQTNDTTLLQRARDQLQELFPSSGNFTPTTLFIATWDRVAQFEGKSLANTFQVVIAADQQMTFVFFIYGDIQWGAGANIGFGAGDGTRFFSALTSQVLNIDEGSNVNVTGVYIYRVDLCSVLGLSDAIQVLMNTNTVDEGDFMAPLTIQLQLTPADETLQCDIIIALSVSSGSATEGDDFYLLRQEVTFNQGATTGNTQSVSIHIIDDSLVEGTESFVVSGNVTTPASFVPGGDTVTVNILDNDAIQVELLLNTTTAREDSVIFLDIQYLLIPPNVTLQEPIIVTVTVVNGSATEDEDFSLANSTLTFDTNMSFDQGANDSHIQVLAVNIWDDQLLEGTESFVISGHVTEPASFVPGRDMVTVDILDNDVAVIGFNQTAYTFEEGDGTVEVCVAFLQPRDPSQISPTIDRSIQLIGSTSSDTANGSDFQLDPDRKLVTMSNRCFGIIIKEDNNPEPTEKFNLSFNVTLVQAEGVNINTSSDAIIFIQDDDVAVIGFNQTAYTFEEGDGTVEVCAVFLDPGQTAPNVVAELMGSISPNTSAEKDFEIVNATVLLGNNRGCFRIVIVDDSDPEPAENFTISFVVSKVQPEGVNISINQSEAVIIIQENDQFQVQFLCNSTIVNESDAASSVKISVEILVASFAILPSKITVTVSATSEDFSLPTNNKLVFLAGTDNGTIQTFVITIHDDKLVEGTETFVISGSVTPPAMFLPGRNMTTITIMDNEHMQVQFQQNSTEEREDVKPRIFLGIQVQIDPPTAILKTEVTLTFSVDGNTTENEDLHLVFQTLTLCQGTSNGNVQSLVVDIKRDFLVEGTESFVISGSATAPASFVPGRESITVTILDDDAIQVQFLQNTSTVDEGDSAIPLTVQLQLTPPGATLQYDIIIISLSVSSDSATEHNDFRLLGQEVTFDRGATTGNTQNVSIYIIDDSLVEGTERFVVSGNVTTPASFVPGGDTVTVNILDNDEIQVEFLLNTTTAREDSVAVRLYIQFQLIPPNVTLQEPIIVTVAVVNGSATEDEDFSLANSTPTFDTNVTFDQGANDSNVQVLAINIWDDQLVEGTESFVVSGNVTAPATFVPGGDTVTVGILDNDVAVIEFNQTTYTFEEDDGTVEVCTTFTDPRQIAPSVVVELMGSTSPGTANSSDFQLDLDRNSVTVTSNASDRGRCFRITIAEDSDRETTEHFNISFNVSSVQPEGVIINTSTEAIVYIQDDDDAPPPSGTSSSEATSSTDTGAVIGGTLLGVLALVVLVTALLGCLIYYKRRKGRTLNRRVLDETSSHTYHLRNREVEMQQFDIYRAKNELNEEVTRYLQDFPEEMIFHTSNLHLLDSVGQGEFGIVYRARLTRSTLRKTESDIVAVKTIKGFLDPSEVANILKECLKMKAFVHPHVMGILGICLAGQAPYIVMPFMANGSLHSYLRKHRAELLLSEDEDIDLVCKTQKRMIDMCLQIAKGMEYLTEHKLVHRDLAARNCMLDQNYILKVADFGLSENTYAKSYFRQEQTAGVKLPVKWMAYESLTDGMFSEKTDVWSFGVTCWEIFSTAKTPYPGIHPTSLIAQLENGERLPKPNNAACSDSMYEVMLSCWDADPEQRPTFTQLVTTITSVLDPLADYLDVTTFVTGEEQEAETTIIETQVVKSEDEASKEENNADLQGGAHDGARGIGRERRSVLMKFRGQLQKALTFDL